VRDPQGTGRLVAFVLCLQLLVEAKEEKKIAVLTAFTKSRIFIRCSAALRMSFERQNAPNEVTAGICPIRNTGILTGKG